MLYAHTTNYREKMCGAGFTLLELLVVIAIIGILAAVVLATMSVALEKARDTKRIAEAKQIKTALELYYLDHNSYPKVEDVSGAGSAAGCGYPLSAKLGPLLQPKYMDHVPGGEMPQDYRYCATHNGQGYGIFVILEGDDIEGTVPLTGGRDERAWCVTGVNVNVAWYNIGEDGVCGF